jgi:aminoglycoside phosphotransferase (APT) family kinase protein
LLHGDYWPGNLAILDDKGPVVYDWQEAGVGPAVIDLLVFLTKSEWWFARESSDRDRLVRAYRDGLASGIAVRWSDEAWDEIWDHALMWKFLQEWLDLLAASPPTLLQVQGPQLDQIWLRPVAEAIDRRLGKLA